MSSPDPAMINLRPLASPLPLGLVGLAVGSLLLTGQQLHWIPSIQDHPLGLCLLGFVAPLQLICFVFAILSRDEGAATGLAVLSGSWLAIALVTVTGSPGSTSPALGLLLVIAAGLLLVPAAAASLTKPLMTVVFLLAAARFAVSGAYELGGGAGPRVTSGLLGVVLAGVAVYGAAAFALEVSNHGPVLPVFRRPGTAGPGRPDGGPGTVVGEAGIRSHL